MSTTPTIIADESKAAYLTGAIAVGLAHGMPLEHVKQAALRGHEKAAAETQARNERVGSLVELCHTLGKRG